MARHVSVPAAFDDFAATIVEIDITVDCPPNSTGGGVKEGCECDDGFGGGGGLFTGASFLRGWVHSHYYFNLNLNLLLHLHLHSPVRHFVGVSAEREGEWWW